MSEERHVEQHRSLERFHVTKFQYLLFSIATLSILALGYSSIVQSNSTVREAKVLSDVESPAASIIFTQRETLVYATRLAQWSNGGTTRRNVQIARNILAQRLSVIDSSGRSMGSRALAPYWRALNASDAIVASAPPGILPEKMHPAINTAISPIIDEILSQARAVVVSYQRSVDKELIDNAQRDADRDRLNLIFFYIFIVTGVLFLLLNARSNFRNYRAARNILELEQKKLDETIEELHKTQNTVTKLQDLNEAKTTFISTVNHELRTPLTSIIGYIELVREEQEKNPDADISKYLEVLDRNAQILLHVVESILSMSKIDTNKAVKSADKVSLNQVIDNAIFIMQPAIDKSEQKISMSGAEELFVEGDGGQLTQVLINLIGNANKFSPKDSLIEVTLDAVTLKYGREYARISVKDHGIGIPQDDIENLSTRFFRAKNTDAGQYPGTGLGLAIVRQLLELHDGNLKITSTLGKGTTITLLIPLFLTSEEKIIQDRRGDVILRSITSLAEATPATMQAVTHTIGGVIGFYGFENEGRQILDYSRSISEEPTEKEFNENKERILQMLKDTSDEIGGEKDE
jgi:signal transduction histidine kinase